MKKNRIIKKNTIKWRIFKYNIIIIVMLIMLTTFVFNLSIQFYMERDITNQLTAIANRAEETTLRRGPDFLAFFKPKKPLQASDAEYQNTQNYTFRFYFLLDRSLREPLSLLNADFILLDTDKKVITLPEESFFKTSDDLINKITNEFAKVSDNNNDAYMNFTLNGTNYTAIIKPLFSVNSIGPGWIIIFSSLEKVNQLLLVINIILLAILILSSLIVAAFSSLSAKKISAPFSSLNQHIGDIAERKFGSKIHMPVDDELQEFVNNINTMSEKLESYDKAQKTFLQNASHEFRTPLMSIQSYAEGIKYNVVDQKAAVDIIICESQRMTKLVEELLYLSRLDTIEESYHFEMLDFTDLMNTCIDRINGIAVNNGVYISFETPEEAISINADEEKLSRAFTNVLSNSIRYANAVVKINTYIKTHDIFVIISDDGPGIDEKELPNIFERFYKGKKGQFGLGLAISKNVIEKHNGSISAENSESGAIFKITLPIK